MKGNIFLGYARGSVGDVTFSRVKGQQVGRARNRQPSNPRTINQSMQRALFANCVKFHSRGVQQLFKFAFEDKRAAESDYNAFMRHNIHASVRISKQASQSSVYPALGDWMMSFGSLRAPQVTASSDEEDSAWRLTLPSSDSNMTTWGDLSSCLKSDLGCLEGDIITIVHIIAGGATKNNTPAIEPPSGLQPSSWTLSQYKVAADSAEELPSNIHMDNGLVILDYTDLATSTYCQGFAFILSRNTAQGLKVSTSYLVPNAIARDVIDACEDATYLEGVVRSWESADIAILQGALLQEEPELGNIVTSTNPVLPAAGQSLRVNLSRSDFFKPVVIGDIVGRANVNGVICNLEVSAAGSTISIQASGTRLAFEGMRSTGSSMLGESPDDDYVSAIVIYDM